MGRGGGCYLIVWQAMIQKGDEKRGKHKEKNLGGNQECGKRGENHNKKKNGGYVKGKPKKRGPHDKRGGVGSPRSQWRETKRGPWREVSWGGTGWNKP